MSKDQVLLIYDQECPVCHSYSKSVRIKESAGELKLINARDKHQVVDEITAMGLDIDQGMILKIGDQLHYGADAINTLALISRESGVFNKINIWIFKSKRISKVVYPVLRAFRALLLKLLGKTKINNLNCLNNEKF